MTIQLQILYVYCVFIEEDEEKKAHTTYTGYDVVTVRCPLVGFNLNQE